MTRGSTGSGRIVGFDRALLWRLVRFAMTGGAASAVYAVCAFVGVDMLGMSGLVASVLAYLIAIPVSFAGQKYWTFRAKGELSYELPRFFAVQISCLIASALIMTILVDILHLSHILGVAAVIVSIPAASYVLMSRRVFGKHS